MYNNEEFDNQQQHIMQKMLGSREDARMSYGNHYARVINPWIRYISDQMEINQISSPIEMAVMMIQEAENRNDAEILIMNIMTGAMEIIEPS